MKRNTLWVALALGGALGCGRSTGLPPNQPIQRQLALTAFKDDDCEGLRQYIADTAVLQMKSQIEIEKKEWNLFGRSEVGGSVGGQTPGTNDAAAPQTPGPSSYTTTNNQVAGVDEADFVKNDGTRLFVLSGQRLFLNQSWPADQLALKGTLDLEGWPREMFLDGNTVTVFSDVYTAYPMQREPGIAMPVCGGPLSAMDCGFWYSNTTKVTEIDVGDLTHPRVVSEVYLPGRYQTARKVGDQARVVLQDDFRWPEGVKYWPDSGWQQQDQASWDEELDALEQQNERILRSTPLSTWLPEGTRKLADGTRVDLRYQCSDFARSNAPAEMGIVTVASLDMTKPAQDPERRSILAQVSTVYANADALYVASPHWWWWPEAGQSDYTYLYQFDITGPQAQLVAAGGVDGIPFNQFSLDAHDGFLRVATAIDTRIEDPQNPWGRFESTNRITVLRQDGAALTVVGQTADIAKGERLMSARFLGNRAFVTTFKYVDPFFTFDLSDPTHPVAVGQLEVPGYSTYLHAIDDTHVIALGQDFTSTGDVQPVNGIPLQLSLFDVGDLANPKLLARQDVGVGYSGSEALWDHKAFNWYPEKKLLAIPFSDWLPNATDYWGGFVSDLRVFSVDPASGITARGALSMRDVYVQDGLNAWQFYWEPQIRRSVMADDFVYAISDAGLRVANIASLDQPVATVAFPVPPSLAP